MDSQPSFPNLIKETTPILLKLLQEIKRKEQHQTHSLKPALHSNQNPIKTLSEK
jgi:hypothetical protein